jgi:hypothetical protein
VNTRKQAVSSVGTDTILLLFGLTISFREHTRTGVPVMILSLLIASGCD